MGAPANEGAGREGGLAAAGAGPDVGLRPRSLRELFVTFTLLALQGFGGVLAVAQRVLCEEKRWLTRAEFVGMLSVGQVLPGPNVCNVALMLGTRFFGWRGAIAALGGLLAAPFGIVLALAALYAHWAENPAVAGALRGAGAVSAGLFAGTALKLAGALRGSVLGVPACAGLFAAVFAAVALFHAPLGWTLLAAGAVACLLAWRRGGEGGR
jgi:chromate transporter